MARPSLSPAIQPIDVFAAAPDVPDAGELDLARQLAERRERRLRAAAARADELAAAALRGELNALPDDIEDVLEVGEVLGLNQQWLANALRLAADKRRYEGVVRDTPDHAEESAKLRAEIGKLIEKIKPFRAQIAEREKRLASFEEATELRTRYTAHASGAAHEVASMRRSLRERLERAIAEGR